MENKEVKTENLNPELFEFVQFGSKITDSKLATKRIGYFKDAFMRFCRNKASIAAAMIILVLVLFAIVAPIAGSTPYTETRNDTTVQKYQKLLPRNTLFEKIGIWDGTKVEDMNINNYYYNLAIGLETGLNPIREVKEEYLFQGKKYYKVKWNSYYGLGIIQENFTIDQYNALQKFQDENDIQIIFPAVTPRSGLLASDHNIWYVHDQKGNAILDKNGNFTDSYIKETANSNTYDDAYFSKMRIASDDGTYKYAILGGTEAAPTYTCRISLYNYFIYKYGYEPSFLFGTDGSGYDIFTRLASGARLSFLLAIFVASVNLVIGAIWGSIAGYYGGKTDLIMERITDILGNVPFMVVTTLVQLHLRDKVGALPSLLFAFVLTGWIGTASLVRMQFYRYKNQEYVLAARTLGAKNKRIMFKHIFPNALGTIITSSVLVIPSVIFSESSLTYLGIVNLDSDEMTSVGTMLANSREFLRTYPHIILFPALFISLLMITFNLFGNGLRDAFNPSLRGTED